MFWNNCIALCIALHTKLNQLLQGQNRIEASLYNLNNRMRKMALDFAAMEVEIQGIADVEEAAEVTLTRLAEEIKRLSEQVTNPADQAKLGELSAQLQATKRKLATAIATPPTS